MALKTLEGRRIASGDMTRSFTAIALPRAFSSVSATSQLDDDVTIFSQRGVFRLITDHHIQRGPSFPKPIDVLIDVRADIRWTKDIQEEVGRQAVRHVGREVEVVLLDFAVFVTRGYLPGQRVGVTQSFATITGTNYVATFDLGYGGNSAAFGGPVSVRATPGGSSSTFTSGAGSPNPAVWNLETFDFTATSSLTQLSIMASRQRVAPTSAWIAST